MALGRNIKALRTLVGLSRPELAAALGLDPQKGQQRIYALEERDSSKSDLAPALATHFAVKLHALLEDDLTLIDRAVYSHMVEQTQNDLHKLVEEEGDVLGNAVRGLSPGSKRLVQQVIDAEYSGELTEGMVEALQKTLDVALELKRALNTAESNRDLEHVKQMTG
jgi:transcriptional regulator with XRE-family HTH domain